MKGQPRKREAVRSACQTRDGFQERLAGTPGKREKKPQRTGGKKK